MAKKRSYLQGQIENPNSQMFGANNPFVEIAKLPKLTPQQQADMDAEVAQQKEIEKQLEEYEAKLKEQAEAERLAPKNEFEAEIASQVPKETYKSYKQVKEEIGKLENKNWIKQVDKTSSFFDDNGINPMAPLYWLADAVTPNTFNMSDAEKKKYKELTKQRRAIEMPIAQAKLKQVQEDLKKMQSDREAWNKSVDDYHAKSNKPFWERALDKNNPSNQMTADKELPLMVALRKLERQEDILNKFLNGDDSVLDGLGTEKVGMMTAGVSNVIENLTVASVAKKQREGVKLAPHEENLLKTYNYEQQVDNLDLGSDRFWYRTGQGTGHSVVFMEQMLATAPVGGMGGFATKAVVTPLTERLALRTLTSNIGTELTKRELAQLAAINYVEKGLIGTGNLLTQAAAMPATYDFAAKKYIGQTQLITDKDGNEKVLVSASARKAYEKEAKTAIAVLTQKEQALENKPNKTQDDLNKLQEYRSKIQEVSGMLNSIYDPTGKNILEDMSEEDAFIYGYTESLKELASERFVGEAVGKALKPISKKLAGSKVDKFFRPVTNAYNKGIDYLNNTGLGKLSSSAAGHTGAARMFHGLPGEIAEEIAVQLTPTYTENYSKQLEELTNPRFYADVIAQTLLMGGGFTTLGASQHAVNYATDKEYRDNYKKNKDTKKELRKLYRDIDNTISDDNLAEHIVMNTGGSLFSLQDYQRKVAELRTEGKNEEADKLEKKSFTNLAIRALETGTLDSFGRSLRRLSTNENVSDETKSNAVSSLSIVDELSKVQEEHSGKVNFSDIANLSINQVLNKQTLNEIDTRLNKIRTEGKESIDKFNKQRGFDNYQSVDSILDQLEDGNLDLETNNNYVSYVKSLLKDNVGNINEYIQMRNFKKNFEEIDFQNEIELNNQINPLNQKYFEEKYKKEKELAANATLETTLDKDSVFQVVKQLTNELEDNEELLGTLHIEDGKRFIQIKNKDNGEVRTLELDSKNNILEKAAEKVREIEVNETLGVTPDTVVPTPQPVVESSEELTETQNSLLDALLAQQDEAPDDVLDEPIFSRRRSEKPVSHLSELANRVATELDNKLGRKANFNDLIESYIKGKTYKEVEDKFNFFADVWDLTGREFNADETYNTYFGSLDTLFDLADDYLLDSSSEVQVVQANKEAENNLQEVTAKKGNYDLNGKPQTVDIDDSNREDRRTLNSGLKAAFNFQDSIRLDDTTWQVVSRKLTTNDLIDNHYILDPSFVKPGMEFNVVQMDLDSIPMMEYTEDGSTLQTTWGLYKVKHNIQEGSELWNMKVPMVAVYDNQGTPVPVFMIHEPSWYRESNISDREGVEKQQAIANEGFERVKELRQQIANGTNKIVVQSKHFGSLDKLNQHKDKTPLSINQATGDSTIAIVKKEGNLLVLETSKGRRFTGLTSNDINALDSTGRPIYTVGSVVDIRPATVNENNEDVFMVLHTMNNSPIAPTESLKQDLNTQIVNNSKFALLSSILLNNTENTKLRQQIEEKYNFTLEKANVIKQQVQRDTGINISTNIADYIGLFVQMGKINETLDKVANNANYKPGLTYFDNKYLDTKTGQWKSIPNAIQVMHKADFKVGEENYKGQIGIGNKLTDNPNVDAVQITLNNFEKLFNPTTGVFKKSQFNVNAAFLGKDDIKISNISETGDVIPTSKSYNEVIKDNLRTNIVSHQIKTIDGKSKWILDVQPMIYFETVESNVEEKLDVNESPLERAAKAASNSIEGNSFNTVIQEVSNNLSEAEQDFLNSMLDSFENNPTFDSRWTLTSEQEEEIDNIGNTTIKGISSIENKQLVASLKNLIISSIDFKSHVKIVDIKNALHNSVENNVKPILETNKNILSNLEKLPEEKRLVQNEKGQSLQDVIDKLKTNIDTIESVIEQKDKLLSTRKDALGSITKELNVLFGTNLEEEELFDSEDSFSKSFLEKELKLSYSVGLRLSLFGIPVQNKNGNNITGFLNLPKYHNVDDVVKILLNITSTMPSDWNVLMSRLDDLYKNTELPIYLQLKNKLNSLPDYLKNELLYKSVSKKLTIYKVINSPVYTINSEGKQIITGYNLQVLDENSTKEDIRWRNSIREGFVNSPFGSTDVDFDRVLNLTYTMNAQKALAHYINSTTAPTFEKTREIFYHFGLTFSDNTIKEYLKTNNPFEKNKGILWFVNEKLNDLIKLERDKKGDAKVLLTDKSNNLFSNSSSALNTLIDIEIMLNGTEVANSIRVGGKTMQGIIANTSVYDTVQDLRETTKSDLFNALRNTPLTKGNTILELLENDSKFNQAFSVAFSSPDSYKIHGKNNFGDTDFDKIAEQDNIATTLALYTNTKGNATLVDPKFKKGLEFRIGQMTTSTLADKGRMLYLTTALLDLKGEQIKSVGNKIELDDNVLDYLVTQLFESDLNRILDSYKRGKTNVKEYDTAAKIFTSLPSFNAIEYEGKNIHEYLSNPNFSNQTVDIISKFKELAKEKITDYVNSEVDFKINSQGTEGQYVKYGMYDNTIKDEKTEGIKVKNIDTEYLNSKPGVNSLEKLRYVTAEYVINNILNLNNIHQLFLGDIAFYSKAGKIKGLAFNGDKIDTSKISDPKVYGQILESIGVIIDKRAASLIAPGLKLANSENPLYKNNTHLMHIAVNDVESMSSVMKELIESQYGKLSPEANEIFDEVITINNSLNEATDENEISRLEKRKKYLIEQHLSDLKDYFNITGTDAQEYTTWKAHIDVLYRQGKLTDEEKELVQSAYNKLSKGEEVSKDELKVLMQPIKPVYTGLVPENGIVRPVYIKSSSFPLLPQITKNLMIDEVRKKLESLEEKSGTVVRMSYQTANKIGARNTKLSMQDLYNKSLDELYNDNNTGLLNSAISVLPTKNFKVQQETPSKEDKAYKKGKDSYITMGSQFFKVITGNGINHIENKIFPNLFSEEILTRNGIESVDGMISGKDLDTIYKDVYSEYSDLMKSELYSELGLNNRKHFHDLPNEEKNEVIQNLQKIIKKEIVERGYPTYLEDSIKLVQDSGVLTTEMPLMFDANSHKFESLMLAIVSSRLISHVLPGNSHISASSEGFRKVTNMEAISEKDRTGIVWLGERGTEELKSTINKDGQIVESEVLIKSHYKVKVKTGQDENGVDTYDFKYVDLSSDEYSEPIIEDGKIVGRKLLVDKIDEELLSNFSFRIPTSSHQSGVILKVVGFLPKEAGDLILVPKEHTVQLGEDYDIDKRYIYKSNYYVNPNTGKITKLQYDTELKQYIETVNEILSQEDLTSDKLIGALFNTNLLDEAEEFRNEVEAMGIKPNREGLLNVGNRALNKLKLKMLENSLIDIYKSVYKSPSDEIQRKIFKPLVTDVSEQTAGLMDKYLASNKDYTNFSILSDNYQRYLLKLGADGKGGIGVHSNAVTLEAQLQRLPSYKKVRVVDHVDYESGDPVYFEEAIGGLKTDGYLGKSYRTLDGGRDVADQHGENQNVSTDNINKQIMGKRNENTHTMSVYAFMAHLGFDLSLDEVDTGLGYKGKMHIPSLFMNQPILRDYVELKEKYSSITADFVLDTDTLVLGELSQKYGFEVIPDRTSGDVRTTTFLDDLAYKTNSEKLTGSMLWSNLKAENANKDIQATVLQKFFRFQMKAKKLSEFQQLINLSTSELGISYFEVLQRIATLDKIASTQDFSNIQALVGDVDTIFDGPAEGNTKVGKYHWRPTTIEGKMLINSLKSAQDVLPIFFPYENTAIYKTIEDIFKVSGKDIDKKSASTLKFKYEIMSSLNDFISSNIGLANGNAIDERSRLFVDTDYNKSLATILKSLKDSKHPIMNNLLLKDMKFEINKDGSGISTIVHLADNSSSFDKLSKYEAFNELLQSKEELGTFNGETLTAQQLAQDLASYAFLADNENGATGFRNFISIDYLKILGASRNFRNVFNTITSGEESLLMNNFKQQFFQHNPDRAATISMQNFKQFGFEPIEGDLKAPSKLNSFSILQDEKPEYISIRNNSIKTSTKKWNLYKYNMAKDIYERIDVLGTRGYNEYNSNNVEQKSIIKTSNVNVIQKSENKGVKTYLDKDINQRRVLYSIDELLPASLGVDGILQKIYDSPNTSQEYKQFIKELQDYVKLDVNYVYGPVKSGAFGSYDKLTNTITISSTLMEDALNLSNSSLKGALDIVKEVIFEEIIHSMTVNEFAKYVESEVNGRVMLKENAPLFATKLVALYEAAKEVIPYNERDISTYYSKNIYEFIAGVFVSPDYRAKLEEQEEGFIDRFKRILRDLLGMLFNQSTGQTLRYDQEIFTAINSLLKTEKELNPENKGFEVKQASPSLTSLIQQDKIQVPEVEITRPQPGIIGPDGITYTEKELYEKFPEYGKEVPLTKKEIEEYKNTLGKIKLNNNLNPEENILNIIKLIAPNQNVDTIRTHVAINNLMYGNTLDSEDIRAGMISYGEINNIDSYSPESIGTIINNIIDGIKAYQSLYENVSEEFNENKFLDMFGNGDFTTGGNEFESRFRYPEIKKCK